MPSEKAIERAHRYAFSRRKAYLLDGLFTFATWPLAEATQREVSGYVEPLGLPEVYLQDRVGAARAVFQIAKFTTLSQNETGEDFVICDRAGSFRAGRRDELGQRANVWHGLTGRMRRPMAVVGRRPTIPAEYEQFYDELSPATRRLHERIVEPTLPGIASSFAKEWASGHAIGSEEHALMNIEDVMRGSLAYDAQLLLRLGGVLLSGKLRDRRFEDVSTGSVDGSQPLLIPDAIVD